MTAEEMIAFALGARRITRAQAELLHGKPYEFVCQYLGPAPEVTTKRKAKR